MPGFDATMHEFGKGKLHSGSKRGPVVKDRKQALAIAFSQDEKEGGPAKAAIKGLKRAIGGRHA